MSLRYQTGEAVEIIKMMKTGSIPKVDVYDHEDFKLFTDILEKHNIFVAEDVPFDRTARDTVKEPDFEFRAGFFEKSNGILNTNHLMFIDFYFEPYVFEDYDEISWG